MRRDVLAVRGPKRVNVLLRRGGKFVASHAKALLEESALKEVVKPEEKGTLLAFTASDCLWSRSQ